ncbi:MAG: aspartate/glutamate racemase family protein [Syntrophales bacterium]
MKLIVIPPYRNPAVNMGYVIAASLARMKRMNPSDADEISVEEGYPLADETAARDAEFLAGITPGFLRKVREYSDGGGFDAIVSTGFLDPGFEAARAISRIPVAGALHSSLLAAALIGKRTSIVIGTMPLALAVRQVAESYGLSSKLVSLRPYGHSTTELLKLIDVHRDRLFETPEAGRITAAIVRQCITAITADRVDSLVLGCEPTEFWEDEIRRELDAAGYDEIPLICPLPACVQMAKAMVSMQLKQTPRAYPTDRLRAQPEYA